MNANQVALPTVSEFVRIRGEFEGEEKRREEKRREGKS
jgi:hypothetical protein